MRPRCKRPAFEFLEGRALPSGNVAAVLSGGVLTLTGDKLGNVVSLTRDGDTVTITPDAGTSINKGAAGAAVDVLGVSGAIRIKMGKGNDSVTVAGQELGGAGTPFAVGGGNGDLIVDLGAGADQVRLAGVQAGKISIVTGAGRNAVMITGLDPDGAIGGAADVRTAIYGGLTVIGNKNADSVTLEGVEVSGHVTLALAGGANSALVTPYAGSDANFDVDIGGSFSFDSTLARGVNRVTFDDPAGAGSIRVGRDVHITLGLLGDALTVGSRAELAIGGSVFVSGCCGDDAFALADVDIEGNLILYSGLGDDAIDLDNVSVGGFRWIDGDLDPRSAVENLGFDWAGLLRKLF